MPPTSARALAAALVVVALVGGCAERAGDPPLGAGTSTTSTTSTSTITVPEEPGTFAPEPIEWQDCGSSECAELTVPLDHADPDGPTVELLVARVPASGDRVGAIFVNPGGPGAETARSTRSYATVMPGAVTERFDIVGVDPRGVGGSAPLDCGLPPMELYADDPTPDSQADRDALVATSQRVADDCEANAGELLPHVGTRTIARDMDTVRRAMGDEQISYIGFSYGTVIGQVYADLFPERVRAMVLDGVVELGPDGIEQAEVQAAGFNVALQRFAGRCARDDSCPAGPDAIELLDDVVAASERGDGIPAPGADRPAGPSEVLLGTSYAMYAQMLWGQLERALADAADGDGSRMVELADGYLDLVDFTTFYAVMCLDFDWPDDPAVAFEAGADVAESMGPIGESIVADAVRCTQWPVPPDPLEPITAPGTPPILVISTVGDPATPYESGVAVAERLASGVLLTYEGEGHTVALNREPCVTPILERYLLEVEPPQDGTVC
jgi:pimeloyl-ACP methyl ester carboxylesterase